MSPRSLVGAFTASLILVTAGAASVAVAQDSVTINGKVVLLQVQEIAEDPAASHEVLVRLSTDPALDLVFQLRDDRNISAHQAMFDVLRDAFINDLDVAIEYTVQAGGEQGLVRRVRLASEQVEAVVLPSRPPEANDLVFIVPDDRLGTEAFFPPEVEGATDIEILPLDQSIELSPEVRDSLVRLALEQEQVASAVGGRFAALTVEQMILTADQAKEIPEELLGTLRLDVPVTRMTFFSYDNNQTVEVLLQERELIELTTIDPKEYQPPESPAEAEAAVALAREALGGDVEGLLGRAILAYPTGGDGATDQPINYDTRVLYVMLSEGPGDAPRYTALVDLTNDKVIEAGPAEQ